MDSKNQSEEFPPQNENVEAELTNKKRKYSKQGCAECKRRKIKCDEAKPICWHCRRLDKICVYMPPRMRKNRDGSISAPLEAPPLFDPQQSQSVQLKKEYGLLHPILSQNVQSFHQEQPTFTPNYLSRPANLYSYPTQMAAPQMRYMMPQSQYQIGQTSQSSISTPGSTDSPSVITTPPVYLPPPQTTYQLPPIQIQHQTQTNNDFHRQSVSSLLPATPSPASNFSTSAPVSTTTSAALAPEITTALVTAPTQNTVSTPAQNIKREAHDNISLPPTSQEQTNGASTTISASQSSGSSSLSTEPTTKSHILTGASSLSNHSAEASQIPISTNVMMDFDPVSTADLLANSLNDLLASKIDEVRNNMDNESLSPLFQMFEQGDYHISQDSYFTQEAKNNSVPDFITKPFPLHSFQLSAEHKRYLEFFYYDYAKVIMPFQPSLDLNPAREILLSYANDNNYLLVAILACGALQSHRKTQDPKDETNYCSYLSTCLQLLSTKLQDKSKLKENIEPMLLTVLLLTSYTAISYVQKWRPHLRGAKDLLSTYAPFNEELSLNNYSSYVIAFCRSWYMSIENLAGLSAPLGGTLQSEEEIESMLFDLPKMKVFLENINVSRKDGFNLLYGYTDSMAISLQRLVKYIRRYRNYNDIINSNPSIKKEPDTSIFAVYELISDIQKEAKFEIISKSGCVPKDHFLHPENDLLVPPDFEPVSPEAIERIVLYDGSVEYMSWYDISQQSYVHAAYLIITSMICNFQKRHPMVQELVTKNLQLMVFLRSPTKIQHCGPMLLQLSMYFTGLNSIYDEDRSQVLKFFTHLVELGAASAALTIDKLKKKWEKYDLKLGKEREMKVEFDDFDESELDGDIISY